jgi:glucosylceramidase
MKLKPSLLLCLLTLWSASGFAQVNIWLTDPDKSVLFQRQSASLQFDAALYSAPKSQSVPGATNEPPTIEVDDSQTYQTLDGFGCCLTGGSAMHLIQMAIGKLY